MNCATCKTELSPTFKHAFAQNLCPACGGNIMDEEALAMIEDLKTTISSEAMLKEDTVQKIAMSIVARYDLGLRDEVPRSMLPQQKAAAPKTQHKIAPPSAAAQIARQPAQVVEEDVVKLEDIPEDLSPEERDKILDEVVKKRYNMIEGAVVGTEDDVDMEPLPHEEASDSLFQEGASNPVLEKLRRDRATKGRQGLASGAGGFRRSS